MKSYQVMKNVSANLYLNLKDTSDIKNRLEETVQEIHSQISEDFKDLFGYELVLKNFHSYVDDENYRQCATGLILNTSILGNKNFEIKIECLIDHEKIWIKVKDGEEIPDFREMVKQIENVQNFEGLAEFKEIRAIQ